MAAESHTTSLSAARLRELLHYDAETGVFTWRQRPNGSRRWNTKYAGKVAGYERRFKNRKTSYWAVTIDDQRYPAHRLAYLYMTGEWPAEHIDHIDGDGLNNRWLNLRPATHTQNLANARKPLHNTSGFKGVSYDKRRELYRAYISDGGQQRFLGYRTTAAEAHALYMEAARDLHGKFARPL